MAKPIHEASREELLERALIAIESLAAQNCEDSVMGTIYSIAHAASGRCCEAHKITLVDHILANDIVPQARGFVEQV